MRKNFGKLLLVICIECFLTTMTMLACGHLGDRTTVVYGKVFDENQQPVDSLMVLLSGSRLKGSIDLKSAYTDENGDYEMPWTNWTSRAWGIGCL